MSELTDLFGVQVDFLENGGALLRVGAFVVALSVRQVAELRSELGVGTVSVINESGHALEWHTHALPTKRAGGRNYVLTIRPPTRPPPLRIVSESSPDSAKSLPT